MTMIPQTPATLAATVRAARVSRKWSQADLARRCGLDPAEANRLERGVRLTLSTAKLLGLARVLAGAPTPTPWEPTDYEGWAVLLVELDAKARAPAHTHAA